MADDRLYRKVNRRIIPLNLFAFLDRLAALLAPWFARALHATARGHRA